MGGNLDLFFKIAPILIVTNNYQTFIFGQKLTNPKNKMAFKDNMSVVHSVTISIKLIDDEGCIFFMVLRDNTVACCACLFNGGETGIVFLTSL